MTDLDGRTNSGFDIAAARALLGGILAPWVRELGLSVERIEPAGREPGGAVLRMAYSDRICREGGIICGQALMALADTAMVFAVAAARGAHLPNATIDQTTHFLKPAPKADVLAQARIVRLGKTMAFGQVTLTAASDGRAVAMVSSAYVLL